MKAKLTKTKKLTKNLKFIKKHTQQINNKNHRQAQKKITHTHTSDKALKRTAKRMTNKNNNKKTIKQQQLQQLNV